MSYAFLKTTVLATLESLMSFFSAANFFLGRLNTALAAIFLKAFLPTAFKTLVLTLIAASFLQPENAFLPISLIFLPIVIFVRALQFLNALLPILVTLAAPVTFLSFVQPEKALSPMVLTFFPITTSLMVLSFLKALSFTAVTL